MQVSHTLNVCPMSKQVINDNPLFFLCELCALCGQLLFLGLTDNKCHAPI